MDAGTVAIIVVLVGFFVFLFVFSIVVELVKKPKIDPEDQDDSTLETK